MEGIPSMERNKKMNKLAERIDLEVTYDDLIPVLGILFKRFFQNFQMDFPCTIKDFGFSMEIFVLEVILIITMKSLNMD